MRKTVPLFIPCFFLLFSILYFLVPYLQAATVSGTVGIPNSDMGYRPSASGMKVRIEGTGVSSDIVLVDNFTGNFILTGVPSGDITLLLIEADQQDVFTEASKRIEVNVNQDSVSGITFNLVYHWKELAGYPSPMGTNGYGDWTTHFVSDQIGFLLFRVRGTGIPIERKELYRTVNGGQTWSEIGYWVLDPAQWSVSNPLPVWWNSFYFSDQDHGVVLAGVPGVPCSAVGSGFFYTQDGGQHWTYTVLPVPVNSYSVTIFRFGQISPSHLIAVGGVGCGVQGYSAYFYAAIWESTDAGATWQLKWNSDPNPVGGITALGVNSNGKAIAFISDGHYLLRDVSGAWTIHDTGILTNSGSGPAPADIPMVGYNAWVTNVNIYGTLSLGLYQSEDAGLNWTNISSSAFPYMSFASEEKGFGLAVGPVYSSYDGGITWLYQSAGGGISGHGNDIWAFDTTHAIWHEGGYGDPNGVSQIFSYVEPWEPSFEIIPGISIKDGYIEGGETEVPMASYELLNHSPVPISIDSITLRTTSPSTDSTDISQVKLWLDRNANGYVDQGDTLLAQGVYSANDEALKLTLVQEILLSQQIPQYLMVTYDFAGGLSPGKAFTCSLGGNDIEAVRTDTNSSVLPTSPPDYPLIGRKVTTAQKIFSDNFENDLTNWIVFVDNPPTLAGYGWQIVDTHFVSPTHSAFVEEDSNNQAWATNHYLTLAQPLSLSQNVNYFLTFYHRYHLDPSFKLWVEVSANGGASWDTIGKYGSYDTWAAYSTGDFVYEVLDLNGYAGTGNLLLRFRFDSTAGWYSYGDWYLDDVIVFRIPQQRILNVSKSGTGGGRITSSPSGIDCGTVCSESFDSGTMIILTAQPDQNSVFSTGWSGCDSTNGNQCMVTMNGARSVTATFDQNIPDQYQLSVVKAGTGDGSITSSTKGINCGTDCDETFPISAKPKKVTLKVKPDAYSTFLGWGGDCQTSGRKTSCKLTVDSNKNVTADFGVPDIAISPELYDFGGVTVKQSSSPVTFTIQNNGTGNLTKTKMKAIGTDAKMFKVKGKCNKSIVSGDSCQFTVTFKPKSAGSKIATVQITSNDPDTSTIEIPLSGSGI
jgi:hypothetical protein